MMTRPEAYLARIAKHNANLNAFLEVSANSPRSIKPPVDFAHITGLSVGVKANIAVKGLVCHAGIDAYRNNVAHEDAPVVKALRAGGATILGTLNMHEGALGATTDNYAFGRCHNPWRHGFTPGGSSGGSGAAVAADLCDFALGSDTMGSIRIPAAYCGIYGHKPTTGIVSNQGVLALSHTLDHIGPLARSTEALWHAMCVISDMQTTGTFSPALIEGTRFGVWSGEGIIICESDVSKRFSEITCQLTEAGAVMRPIDPPLYEPGLSRRAGLLVSEVEGASVHAERLTKNPEGFTDAFRSMLEWGLRQPKEKYDAAHAHIAAVRSASRSLWDEIDFVIAPTVPQVAFSFDALTPVNQADFTAWANLAGLPATAIYAGLSADNLPLSVQVIGPEGKDDKTLRMAAALETLLGTAPRPAGFT